MVVRPVLSSESSSRALIVAIVCLVLATTLSPLALAGDRQHDAGHDGALTHHAADDPIGIDEPLESATGTVEVVVRLEEPTVPDAVAEDDAAQYLEEHAEETQQPLLEYVADTPGITVETEFWLTNAVLLEVDTDRVALETFEEFAAVEAVHENFELSVPETPSVNATESEPSGISVGIGTDASTAQSTVGIELLNAPAVWDAYETRGEGVRVAVLDTGIDATHPDLDLYTTDPSDPTYPGGWAAFDADGNRIEGSTPYDSGTHGTHVSGTVAGGATTGTQIGVAPDVELLHGLVLSETDGSFAQVIAGMEWALESEADVISMSLGSTGRYDQLIDPVQHAVDGGAVVVAAIGNEGVATSGSPGNVYDAISVGAVHANGAVPAFSGGERIERSEWRTPLASWPSSYVVPDVVAHGVGVVSTVPGGYAAVPGTSMATPHVSGTVALMLSTTPDATPGEISQALSETAWKPSGENQSAPDTRYGRGIVDAKAATDALIAAHAGPETTTADGETETTTARSTSSSDPFAGVVSVVVAAVCLGALLAARSLARKPDR